MTHAPPSADGPRHSKRLLHQWRFPFGRITPRRIYFAVGLATGALLSLFAAAAGAQSCASAPVNSKADSLIVEANRRQGPRAATVRGLAQRLKVVCPLGSVDPPPPPPPPPPPDPVVLPTPISIAPGSTPPAPIQLASLTPTFSWSTVTGATGYIVAVRDVVSGSIVYPSTTGVGTPISGTSFTLPAGVLVASTGYTWDVTAVNATAKSLASVNRYFTTPAPPPTTTGAIATILGLVGPTKTVTETQALGPIFARYDSVFNEKLPATNTWVDNYYDRGKVYYTRYARTGDAAFLTKANDITLAYRREYLEPNDYKVTPHWSLVRGLEIHYRLTGDTLSRRAVVGMFAQALAGFSVPIWGTPPVPDLQNPQSAYMENRIQARVLHAALSSYRMGASFAGEYGEFGPATWPTRLQTILNQILSVQKADGSFSWVQICGGQLNYMVGMLNDVLIEYFRDFEQDPRIPVAVEKANEYLWSTQWLPTDQAFKYASVVCAPNPFGTMVGGLEPAGDLNGLLIASFGWLYSRTNDPKWRTRADAIMAGLVSDRWASNYTGSKMYNQAFAESYRYLGWRQ